MKGNGLVRLHLIFARYKVPPERVLQVEEQVQAERDRWTIRSL